MPRSTSPYPQIGLAAAGHVQHVVIIGGGYIGLEVAEACQVRGLDVTVVDRSATPVGTFDPENVQHLADEHLLKLDVQVGFRFLDEDQVQRRPALLDLQPPCMKVQQFHDHVDQVLEAEPVVSVR